MKLQKKIAKLKINHTFTQAFRMFKFNCTEGEKWQCNDLQPIINEAGVLVGYISNISLMVDNDNKMVVMATTNYIDTYNDFDIKEMQLNCKLLLDEHTEKEINIVGMLTYYFPSPITVYKHSTN